MVVTNGQEYAHFIKNVLFGTDSDWFEDFKRALGSEGFNVCGVTADPASNSHFATRIDGKLVAIPVLGLYAVGDNAYRLLKVRRDISGMLDDRYKEQIDRIWRECCIRHKVDTDEYCGVGPYVSVKVTEGVIYNHTIRTPECRAEVADAVFRLSFKHPRKVYCSSMPSYNIVFEEADYLVAEIDRKKERITAEIRRIAEKHVSAAYGVELPDPLSVSFFHPKMPNYNGYGLARED